MIIENIEWNARIDGERYGIAVKIDTELTVTNIKEISTLIGKNIEENLNAILALSKKKKAERDTA